MRRGRGAFRPGQNQDVPETDDGQNGNRTEAAPGVDAFFLDAFFRKWVCETHPDKPFPHDDCPGPGMPPPAQSDA
jgi:hypothetical protein